MLRLDYEMYYLNNYFLREWTILNLLTIVNQKDYSRHVLFCDRFAIYVNIRLNYDHVYILYVIERCVCVCVRERACVYIYIHTHTYASYLV